MTHDLTLSVNQILPNFLKSSSLNFQILENVFSQSFSHS